MNSGERETNIAKELRELLERWRSKQNNVFDTLTLKDCADELAALLSRKPAASCKLCAEGMPLKKYLDGTMRHFDGLMAWHPCAAAPAKAEKRVTAEMVQQSVGKFGADLSWCRTVANRLNGLLAADAPAEADKRGQLLSEEQVRELLRETAHEINPEYGEVLDILNRRLLPALLNAALAVPQARAVNFADVVAVLKKQWPWFTFSEAALAEYLGVEEGPLNPPSAGSEALADIAKRLSQLIIEPGYAAKEVRRAVYDLEAIAQHGNEGK